MSFANFQQLQSMSGGPYMKPQVPLQASSSGPAGGMYSQAGSSPWGGSYHMMGSSAMSYGGQDNSGAGYYGGAYDPNSGLSSGDM